MLALFCADVLAPREPDAAYVPEVAAANAAGTPHALISYEALVDGDVVRAVRRIAPATTPLVAVYRGWMLRAAQYAALYEALATKNMYLINTPDQYRYCHHLPESYSVIAQHTPHTVWMETDTDVDFDAVMALLAPFGDAPVVVKDYVKSRKHEWDTACFIPKASDRAQVERVVRQFVALQGDDFTGGLVFREYVTFAPLGTHAQSGMPLTNEYRSFWLDGELLTQAPYWEGNVSSDAAPPFDEFRSVAQRVGSHFFTMDIAQTTDEHWLIVELGDGQVAGLPERIDVAALYRGLRARVSAREEHTNV